MAVSGRMILPLNVGVVESTFETAFGSNNIYTLRGNSTCRANAYKEVSVNPTLLTLGLENETDYVSADGGNPPIASAMFTEIRNSPHTDGISVQCASSIQNRLLPTASTSLSTYATNKENTPSYKVKIYDSHQTTTSVNRKATYSTSSDTPDSNIGLDIENRDYFILLNPDIYDHTAREDTVRPHFAKITRIVTFDEFGDGVEFEPKYTGVIPKGTNFEIYKGPHKTTDSDVVAVSYGLRGDTSASTDKYDKISIVNTPTFYFYNDRLEVENQLDYNEKYTLTSVRYWGSQSITLTSTVGSLAQYEEGSTSKYYVLNQTDHNKLTEGMSIFNGTNYLGNIESKYVNDPFGTISYRIHLDYARQSIAATGSTTSVTIGTTIQNVVFKTERKYNNTIQNLGRDKLDAVLTDNNMVSDDADSNIDPIFWHKTFPNMKRHEEDHTLTYDISTHTIADSGHRKMNGAAKYITWESAALKNDKIPISLNTLVNSPQNKMTKLARITSLDNSGIHHLKYKQNDKMVVRNGLYGSSMKMVLLPHKVTTSSSKLAFNNKSTQDVSVGWNYDYTAILGANSIILIGDYYYRVNAVDAKANDTDQTFSVSHKRLKTASTWTADTTPPTVTSADIYVSHYSNGKFNLGFAADTEIRTAQSNRITMDNHTINLEESKLYNSRITVNGFTGHELKVNYGDKNLKYVTVQDSGKQYYQKTGTNKSRMFYYNGAFTLHEEVFNGVVEETTSKNEGGRIEYEIIGRDSLANLLTNTINKNLNFTDDIVYSSLVPSLDMSSTTHTTSATSAVGTNTISISGVHSFTAYTLFFDSSYNLIGEYHSQTTAGSTTLLTLKGYITTAIGNGATIYNHNPVDNTSRYIAGAKAISSVSSESSRTTDFSDISEKGILFNNGMNYTYSSSTFSYSDLKLTSSDGSYLSDNSIGYSINSPKGIENTNSNNNDFVIKLANEMEDNNTVIAKDISSSLFMHIVDINEIKNNSNVVSVAPNFPVALGVSDTNAQDTRFSPNGSSTNTPSLYFVNSNIPLGGYIHRLQNRFTQQFTPLETYRFLDMQRFEAGSIVPRSYNALSLTPEFELYKNGKRPLKITGYTHGAKVLGNGNAVLSSPIKDTTWWLDPLDRDNLTIDRVNFEDDLNDAELNKLLNHDYRARAFKLFATGDLYPDSFLRFNNLGFASNTNNLSNFGLMFEANGKKGSEISHSWSGKTKATVKNDDDYEISEISSATITNPTQMKRWGIVRLVEATFDWHFNSVDFEALKDRAELPRVKIGDYIKYTDDGTNATGVNFDLYTQVGDKLNALIDIGNHGINMTQVHLLSPNFDTSYFDYGLLDGTGADDYDPPNILLPIVSKMTSETLNVPSGGTEPVFTNSVFHVEKYKDYGTTNQSSLTTIRSHYSKVLSALCKPFIGSTQASTNHNALTDTELRPFDVAFPVNDIYENCIGLFKDMRTGKSGSDTLLSLTSSPLTTSTYSGISGGSTDANVLNRQKQDQPTSNIIMIEEAYNSSNTDLAFIATKSISYPFDNREGYTNASNASSPTRATTHLNHNSGTGELYSAQMVVKPQFNITTTTTLSSNYTDGSTALVLTDATDFPSSGSGTINNVTFSWTNKSGNTLTVPDLDANYTAGVIVGYTTTTVEFTMDTNSTHHWLNFVPNLEGYYIVSNKLSDGTNNTSYLPTKQNGVTTYSAKGVPKCIAKIISHTITTSSNIKTHSLKFDVDINTATHGNYFRLMRISDTTFEDTPDFIEINMMHDSGLEYNTVPENFRTGEISSKNEYGEGLYSMYMLLNIDKLVTTDTNNYLEKRVISTSANIMPVSDGEEIDCYITDGINSQRKSLTITLSDETATLAPIFKMEYDGKLNGNGCVSFGEIFDITIPKELKIKPTNCYIGTTFSVGSLVDNEISDIIKSVGLDIDINDSLRKYTGLIVNSVSGNVITLLNNPITLYDGADFTSLYNQDGHLIGKVTARTTSSPYTVTIGGGIIFTPSQYDELTTRDKKTYVSNANFQDVDAFSAINYLTTKKDLTYKLKNKVLTFRDMNDSYGLRRYNVDYKRNNRLISVDSNKSLFDRANKIIVLGDGVKSEIEIPTNGISRTIRHLDPSIKSLSDAKIKSAQLLRVHSSDNRKITLTLQKEGLELLESGDIISLDFPNHDIPRDDYTVFEIENALAGVTKITVGTFNKSTAERLSEIQISQSNSGFSIFNRNVSSSSVGLALFDNIDINNNLIKYEIKTTSAGTPATMGFGLVLGFGTDVGFGETSTTVIKSYESEKDV